MVEQLEIFKGDDSDFSLNQRISVKLLTDLDVSGMTAEVQVYDYIQTYNPIPENKRLPLVFPANVTKKFPLGKCMAKIRLFDKCGRRRTVENQLCVLVTNSVDCLSRQDIGYTMVLEMSYNDLHDLPTLGGKVISGSHNADYYGLATPEDVANGNVKAFPPYLHSLSFDDIYIKDAREWYDRHTDSISGGCTAVRKGNLLGRNYDWKFSEAAEFVVHVSANDTRHASVGVASLGEELTEQMVCSGKYTALYRVLPGMTLDGINDAGVVAEINMIPRYPGLDPVQGGERNLHALEVVRFVLDNFSDAGEAAKYVAEHYYIPEGVYSYHWMIADANHTYVVEESTYCEWAGITDKLTNFRIFKGELDIENEFGTGFSRYQILNTSEQVDELLKKTRYTKTYDTGWPWPDEFAAPGIGIHTDTDVLRQWANEHVSPHVDPETRKPIARDGILWQTVHSSIYDLKAKTLSVAVQEDFDTRFVFSTSSPASSVSWDSVTDKPNTLSGYDIHDAYTQTEVNRLLQEKRDAVDYRALRRVCDIWKWERIAGDSAEGTEDTPEDFLALANMANATYPEYKEVSKDWWYAGIYWPNGLFRYEATSGLAGSATTANLVYAFVSFDEEGREAARFRARATRDPSKVNDRSIEPPEAYGGNPFARIASTEWVHYVVDTAKEWMKALLPSWLTPTFEMPATMDYVLGVEERLDRVDSKSQEAESKADYAIDELANKVDKGTTYTKNEVDAELNIKRDKTDLATYVSHDKISSWTYIRGGIEKPLYADLYEDGQNDRVRWRISSPNVDIRYYPSSGLLQVYYKPVQTSEVILETFDLEKHKDPKSLDPSVNDLGGPYTLSNGYIIEFNRAERGAIEPDGDSLAKVSQIPPSVALDDTVTQDSSNGVKSSGIWAFVTGLIPKWLTPDYAEPATVSSVESKVSKSGDTMTGKLIVQAESDTDTGFLAKRNDTHWTEYKAGQINVRSSGDKTKATRILSFPDHGGEIALKEDLPDVSGKRDYDDRSWGESVFGFKANGDSVVLERIDDIVYFKEVPDAVGDDNYTEYQLSFVGGGGVVDDRWEYHVRHYTGGDRDLDKSSMSEGGSVEDAIIVVTGDAGNKTFVKGEYHTDSLALSSEIPASVDVIKQSEVTDSTPYGKAADAKDLKEALADKVPWANDAHNAVTIGSRARGSEIGANSLGQGSNVKATGDYSHAEGDNSHAEGYCSHAEGTGSHAEGYSSHAEGGASHAEGDSSHAEGYSSHAEGDNSHAEGDSSHAEGYSSHAEGYGSHAEGDYSHAEGYYARTGNGTTGHDRAFAWQGLNMLTYYNSHGDGTFNINPAPAAESTDPKSGVWIGEEKLSDAFAAKANVSDFSPSSRAQYVKDFMQELVLLLAPAFNNATVYSEGDAVSHDGKLYKRNSTEGADTTWIPAHWTETDMVHILT